MQNKTPPFVISETYTMKYPCKSYPIAEGAVMRGEGSLIVLNQQVMTPYGEGKVVWFSVTPSGSRIAHVVVNGFLTPFFFDELQPVSEASAQTEGVAQ